MSKNLNQIPTAATSIVATDKMYIARSPFGVTDDRYILGSDILTQLASPLIAKGDIYTFSTVDARLPVGANGQILQANSAQAVGLSWSTPTYPSASGAVGKILISDGTNNVYSTPTYPNTAGTIGSIIISDGTNKINSTSLWPNTVGTALHLILSNGTSNVYSTPAYPNASVTTGKFIISDGTNYIASTSIMPNTVGSAGTIIRSDGTINTYSTSTFADLYSINNILFASSANTITGLATLASGVLVTSAGGVPSISTTLPAGLTIPGYQTTITLPLSLANGGTNAALTANTGGIFYSTASAGAILSGTATANQVILSGATAAPSWSTATYLSTLTANGIIFASASNVMAQIASAASSVLITSAGSVPSLSQTLPAAVQGNITTVGTITSGVWNGSIISLTYGGTNAALTASNGGIVWSNATQMQIIAGTATASQMLQSGSTAAPTWSTTTWPSTSTAGRLLYSTFTNTIGELTTTAGSVLTSSAGSVPAWVAASTSGNVLTSNGTTWVSSPATGSGTVNSGTQNQLAWYAANGTAVSGLTTANNGLLVTSSAGVPSILAGPGTTGNVLISNAAAAPSFTTFTYPTTVGASGSIHISNGTNIVSSTSLWPNTVGSAGMILRSDGTTNAYTTTTYPNTNAINTIMYASSANVLGVIAAVNSAVLISSSGGVPSMSTTLPSGIAATNMALTTPAFTGVPTGTVTAGVYTPTVTTVANASAAAGGNSQYIRVGNQVMVTGTMTVDAVTTLTITQVRISLPIASNIGSTGDASGVLASSVANASGRIEGESGSDTAQCQWVPVSTSNDTYGFTFTYQVI